MKKSQSQFTNTIHEDSEEDMGHSSQYIPIQYNYNDDIIAGYEQTQHLKVKQLPQSNEISTPQHELATVLKSNHSKHLMNSDSSSSIPFKKSTSFEGVNVADSISSGDIDKKSQLTPHSKQPSVGKSSSQQQVESHMISNNSLIPLNTEIPLCKKHRINITLMCCVSQWHCEALCVECVPEHTEAHNKNRTQPILKRFETAKQDCLEKCDTLREQLALCHSDLMLTMKQNYSDQNLVHLRMWRIQTIQIFDVYFDQIEHDYNQRAQVVHMQQMQKLERVSLEIEKVLNDLQSFENDVNSQTFFVKGIANTLKLNVSSFVTDLHQEIDKIHSIYVLEEELKLNLKLVEYLHRNIGGLVTAEKTVLKKEKKKLTTTLKTKSKQCSECGNEMVYVSEFKKHLECPYCSNVKRPNTKLQN